MRYRLAIVVVLLLALTAQAGQTRDWKQYPVVAESAMPKELYAMGDVHGDDERMVELLTVAHLVSGQAKTVQWTGGKAVLVCTGDLIDKYSHGIDVIATLRSLQAKAETDGGRIIVTMGNHEAEFLAGGGEDKKSNEFEEELKAAGIAATDVAAGRDSAGIGQWMRSLPIAAKVGDWFFCHAGNTQGRTVAQLTDETEKEFAEHGFDSPILIDPGSLLEARMHPRVWWDWDGSSPELKDESKHEKKKEKSKLDPGEARLRQGIEALGCQHLVFGHQPGKIEFADGSVRDAGELYSKFDGLVFLIDTGISRGVPGGHGAILRIKEGSNHHKVEAISADGKIETMVP